IFIGGVSEYHLREQGIKSDYDRIVRAEYEATQGETKAVIDRVKGCHRKINSNETWKGVERYIKERLYGNCRSLNQAHLVNAVLSFAVLRSADLHSADLRDADLFNAYLSDAVLTFADLRDADLRNADLSDADLFNAYLSSAVLTFADLRDADLRDTDLRDADLRDTDLRDADLRDADLRYANLSSANLSSADLSSAILLKTDFRESRNLTMDQLSGENQPYLCNVALPSTITNIDPNRDCDKISQLLSDRYLIPIERAQQIVEEAKQKQWE
ncbi:MAG: pentapeptide repeat-containing protein, partial [Merismopedia sp. SIO2A8]|nr:pentapeptide repeat-containing protein [Merismopedia sp. SIO2A8]